MTIIIIIIERKMLGRFDILKLDDKLRENRENNNRRRKRELAEAADNNNINININNSHTYPVKTHTAAVQHAKGLLSEKDANGKRMFSDREVSKYSSLPYHEVQLLSSSIEKQERGILLFGGKREALAQVKPGVHIQGPAPTCSVSGSTVTCSSFQIAGLGNTAATAELQITGTFSTQCTNPGGNVAPGQNSQASGTSGPVSISTDKNGKATVPSLSATAQPPSQTQLNALCSNPQWTGSVTGFTVTSATILVTQNGGIVFSQQVI